MHSLECEYFVYENEKKKVQNFRHDANGLRGHKKPVQFSVLLYYEKND
jgi:hypothetical protein